MLDAPAIEGRERREVGHDLGVDLRRGLAGGQAAADILTDRNLDRVLGTALEQRADWADCYFEYRVVQTASLEEGVVRKATRNVRQGVPRSGL